MFRSVSLRTWTCSWRSSPVYLEFSAHTLSLIHGQESCGCTVMIDKLDESIWIVSRLVYDLASHDLSHLREYLDEQLLTHSLIEVSDIQCLRLRSWLISCHWRRGRQTIYHPISVHGSAVIHSRFCLEVQWRITVAQTIVSMTSTAIGSIKSCSIVSHDEIRVPFDFRLKSWLSQQ